VYADLVSSNKTYEKEIKFLNDRLQNEQKNRIVDENIFKKKIAELSENDAKTKQSLNDLKLEFSSKMAGLNKAFESEKEVLKKGISDIEQKFRESENKRSSLMFEMEKVRNNSEIEKKNLIERNQEKVDQIRLLERRIDLLTRENEKVRNEKSQTKIKLQKISFGSRFGSDNKENQKLFENSFEKSLLDTSHLNMPKMVSPSNTTLKTKSRQSHVSSELKLDLENKLEKEQF